MKTATILLSCLLASALSAGVHAQGKLVLPRDSKDFQALMKPVESGKCDPCGVVTNVRTEPRARSGGQTSPQGSGSLQTTPILSSSSGGVNDYRKSIQPDVFYKITVRLDSGSYAFYDQDDEPIVRKGDRVRIVDNKVSLQTQ